MRLLLLVLCLLVYGGVSNAVECKKPTGKPIKIGVVSSYSGPAAIFTQSSKAGLEYAAGKINCAGGILNRPLELLFRDDKYNPEEAQKAVNELILKEKVNFLSGCLNVATCLTMASLAKKNKIIYFPEFGAQSDLTWKHGHKYVARFTNNAYLYSAAIANFAGKQNIKRWITISPNDDFGKDVFNGFKDGLKKANPSAEIVKEFWPQISDTDFSPMISAMAPLKGEGLFSGLWGATEIGFVKQAGSFGTFKKMKLASCCVGTPEEAAALGKDLPENSMAFYFPIHDAAYIKANPGVTDFVNEYKEFSKGTEPNFGVQWAYQSLLGLEKAINMAKSIDTEKVAAQLGKGFSYPTPWGSMTLRGCDQQVLPPQWVGFQSRNTKGDIEYKDLQKVDSETVAPSCDQIKEWRKNAATS